MSSLLQSSPQLWSMLSLLSAQLFSPLIFFSTHPTSRLVSDASSLCILSSCAAFCFATHLRSFWVGSPSSSCLTETRGAVLGLSGGWMGVSISISSTFTCTVHTTKSQKRKSVQASHKDKIKCRAGVHLHTLLLLWLHLGINERHIGIVAEVFQLFRVAQVRDLRIPASVSFSAFQRQPLFCIPLSYWKPNQ